MPKAFDASEVVPDKRHVTVLSRLPGVRRRVDRHEHVERVL
jgi:hypothetical protein